MEFEYVEDSGEAPPIAQFGNGDLDIQHANKRLRIGYYQHNMRDKCRLLVAESDRVEYIAKYNPAQSARDLKHMVGVVDKDTKKVRLHSAKFFMMGMKVKNEVKTSIKDRTLETIQQKRDARTQLVQEFGGKRKKAEISTRERSKVSAEALSGMSSLLDSTLSAKAKSEMSEEARDRLVDSKRPVPKFNRSATEAKHIYPLKHMITPPEMDALKAVTRELGKLKAKGLKAMVSQEDKPHCPLVLDYLNTFVQLPSKTKQSKAAVVLYWSYLITLFKSISHFNDLMAAKLDEALPDSIPPFVKKTMLRKFVEGKPGAKRYKVSALKKDTLVSYIIILALVVQDFQAISVEALAMELGLKISKAVQHFKAVGCMVMTASKGTGEDESGVKQKMGALTVPLKFPKPRSIPQRN